MMVTIMTMLIFAVGNKGGKKESRREKRDSKKREIGKRKIKIDGTLLAPL